MSNNRLQIRELVGWPLDAYEHRPADTDPAVITRAVKSVRARKAYEIARALLPDEACAHKSFFHQQASRADLLDEVRGLVWSLGVVDLRKLIAFQRRLTFHPTHIIQPEPFGPPKPIACTATQCGRAIVVQTSDPNVHLRVIDGQPRLHAGSPFFEVAEYRGRWFLRDGYHRAYAMLRAGVTQSPAVVVHARTLAELGAVQPWFFPEGVLFSAHPPRVADFLDDALNIEYTRPALIKTLRVTIEETYTPARSTDLQGDPS